MQSRAVFWVEPVSAGFIPHAARLQGAVSLYFNPWSIYNLFWLRVKNWRRPIPHPFFRMGHGVINRYL